LLQLRLNQPDAAGQSLKKAAEIAPTSPQAQLLWLAFINRVASSLTQNNNSSKRSLQVRKTRTCGQHWSNCMPVRVRKAEAEEVTQQAKRDLPDNSAGYRMPGDY